MPEEYFGINSINILERILRAHNPKKVFLVCGKKSFTISGADKKIKPFFRKLSYGV